MASLRSFLVTFFLLFASLAAAWPLNPRGGQRCEKSIDGTHTCPQGEYCNTLAFAVPAQSIKPGKPLKGLCMISSVHGPKPAKVSEEKPATKPEVVETVKEFDTQVTSGAWKQDDLK
jgi:hypothetical protein